MSRSPSATQRSRFIVIMIAVAVTGCSAGPDYKKPKTNLPGEWNGAGGSGLETKRLDKDSLNGWWRKLNDRKLNSLINRAVDGNLSLRSAAARLQEARAQRVVAGSARFPTLNARGGAARSEFSETSRTPFQTGNVYSGGFDAAWELDLFGGLRRQAEAAEANVEARVQDLGDVLVTLLAETALNYLEVRSYQARLEVAEANRDSQLKTLELVEGIVAAGEVSNLDLEQARANLETTRSQIPILNIALSRAEHRLAILLGKAPGSLNKELQSREPIPLAPSDIAIGIPAEVLRRRPDVLRTERELAAQTALVGVATADLYPKLRLIGTVGLESLSSGNFLKSASRVFSVGPSVQWNLFNAGRVRQNIQVQNARQEQALIRYESAILTALKDVEDALVSYGNEMVRRDSLIRAEAAVKRTVEIAQDQYKGGETTFLTVLDAQRSQLQLQDQLAQSNAQVTTNVIMLYKALGGGWR